MMITWRETCSYLTRLGVRKGSRVLIIGSGGNGLAYASHARNLGAASVVLVGSQARQEAGKRAGASHYLDYRLSDLSQRIVAEHPEPFDFIVDAVGKTGMLNPLLCLLRNGGMIGIYGIDDFDTYSLNPFRATGNITFFHGGYDEEEAHATVVEQVRAGKLEADIWLDLEHPFSLSDIEQAMAAATARQTVKALVDLQT